MPARFPRAAFAQGKIESMYRILLMCLVGLTALPVLAEETAQVMLLGTFHFQDAGMDVVKPTDIDIFSEDSQSYLHEFATRLAAYRPSRVLLEYASDDDEIINQRYREYRAGTFELPANEIYQLGFRIARQAGHERVYGFDQRDVEWQAEAMFEYAKEHGSPEMEVFNEIISRLSADDRQARESMSLRELLVRVNQPQMERINMDLYLATNAVGAEDGYSGADAAASWWHRNFRMYANIQRLAQPKDRLIVIGGSGHIAILRQLLSIDRSLQAVSADPYF